MTAVWVLGAGGMLGSAIQRSVLRDPVDLFVPGEPLPWRNEAQLLERLPILTRAFLQHAQPAGRWEIYWAAGVGTMGSRAEEMGLETRALATLLDALGEALRQREMPPGAIAFASSAGAIYAGSAEEIVDEDSPPSPTTAYGRVKLEQEELLARFAAQRAGVSLLLARISTLYGPGQSSGKRQGLLAHIARSIVRHRPVQIYVPLDTARDYIHIEDVAQEMMQSLRGITGSQQVVTKIIAAGQAVTIAEIISTFRRVARRAPLVVTSTNKLSGLYTRCVRYRSKRVLLDGAPRRSSLLVGIAQLLESEREAFAHGRPADKP